MTSGGTGTIGPGRNARQAVIAVTTSAAAEGSPAAATGMRRTGIGAAATAEDEAHPANMVALDTSANADSATMSDPGATVVERATVAISSAIGAALVVGIEGDIAWSAISDEVTTRAPGDPAIGLPPLDFTTDLEMHWFATARGRAGLAFDGTQTGQDAAHRNHTTPSLLKGGENRCHLRRPDQAWSSQIFIRMKIGSGKRRMMSMIRRQPPRM
jgi:hypothetical protein